MQTTQDLVRLQYEKYPYPKYSWLARAVPIAAAHANFEAGASLTHKRISSHNGKKIGLFGCGTFEPYLFGATHLKADITAIDVSQSSLRTAKNRCYLNFVRNVEFECMELTQISKPSAFDYIHAYGVLHHLPNFEKGFKKVAESLKPDGFARIMVYSQAGRRRIQEIQKLLKSFNLSPFNKADLRRIKELFESLPDKHPLKLTYLFHPETSSSSGLVDAFLHQFEKGFLVSELHEILEKSGLTIRAWDFSENIKNLLVTARGQSLLEKIYFLEAFNQWPSHFSVWVSKLSSPLPPTQVWFTNPLATKRSQREFYSPLLRKAIRLTASQWNLLKSASRIPLEATDAPSQEIQDLLNARLLLEGV